MNRTKKRVSFIGTVGVPGNYGGFETLVEQLVVNLCNELNIAVFCSASQYPKYNRHTFKYKVKRCFIPLKANGLQSIPYDLISIIMSVFSSEFIFIFGGSAGIILPIIRLFFPRKRMFFHPDGEEWKREKWNFIARSYLRISIKAACMAAHKVIIDNQELNTHYTDYKHKLVNISYGGDQYETYTRGEIQGKYWLTIARMEPENNLKMIAQVFTKHSDQKWILITNSSKGRFNKDLLDLINKHPNLSIVVDCYDKYHIAEYYNGCKGYIHGHSVGGTNPTLTSAMWVNKPLLCHNNKFNRHTTANNAFFFSDENDLEKLILLPNKDLQQHINNAILTASEKYTWEKVANDYKKLLF